MLTSCFGSFSANNRVYPIIWGPGICTQYPLEGR